MIKVKRSYPAPESLAEEAKKSSGKYDKPDVIKRLKKDFYEKCYICGMDNLQDPQIEHLFPHENGKYPERKFDWDNLFWSCGHCNSVKNQLKYASGILNCCIDDPEQEMIFLLSDNKVSVVAKNVENQKAVLASMLVEEVFSLQNTGMREYKSDMRLQELNKEMIGAYLTFSFTPGINTFFKNVYKLRPGHYLKYKNMKMLDSIAAEDRGKCEFLVNAICPPGCPNRKEHYRLNGLFSLTYGRPYATQDCPIVSNTLGPEQTCSHNNLTPEEIYKTYIPKGFVNFKLEGRTASATDLIEVLLYYLIK